MPPIGSGVMTPDGLGRVCALQFLSNEISVKTEDGKIKNFKKEEIESVIWMDFEECKDAVRNNIIPTCIDIAELELIEEHM